MEGVGFGDLQGNLGGFFLKRREEAAGNEFGGGGNDPQLDGAGNFLIQADNFRFRKLAEIEDGKRPFIEGFAGQSQPDMAGAALKERYAQLLLQQLHLMAERRLGEMQPAGGQGNSSFVDDSNKVAKLPEFHSVFLPFFCIIPQKREVVTETIFFKYGFYIF